MTLRVSQVRFRNLSRRTAKELSNELFGVVGDQIKAEITVTWASVFGDDFEIIFTPAPISIGLPPATSTIGYVHCPDGIFTSDSFKVGDKIGVKKTGETLAYFDILEVIDETLLRFDVGSSTIFNSTWTVAADEYCGCAPDINNVEFNFALSDNFNSFDLDSVGCGRWVGFEQTVGTKIYTQVSKGINRQGNFTTGQIIRTANALTFDLTIEHTFILLPFYLEGEIQPEIPSRFLGANCLNYFFSISIKKHDKQNTRTILATAMNGNTGGISQVVNSGVDLLNFSNLAIVDSSNNPIGAVLQPDEYTATLRLNYTSPAAVNADDTCKAWGYIEQPTIDWTKNFRDYFIFDSATRRNVDFLTAGASANDFSDYILIKTVQAATVSGNTVVTIIFKVTDLMPSGNLILCLNLEADTNDNSRKCLFIGSYPISKTPPDLKIRFEDTKMISHFFDDEEVSNDREITPVYEALFVNRFFVDLPNDVRIQQIRSRFVAQNGSGGFINTLEQTVIDTATAPVLDGQFQNLVFSINKAYPRASNDIFRRITINRNPALDVSTERCFEVKTPVIFRYEEWRQFLALNGENLPTGAFDPNLPFNGFQQVWQRYSSYFEHIIDLVCLIDGQVFTISSPLNSNGIDFEDYTTGSIVVENDVQNGLVLGFADNIVKASKTHVDFEGVDLANAGGILWANIKNQGGIETNARISTLRPADPSGIWKPNNATLSKPSDDTFLIQATLDGRKLPSGSEVRIWADLRLKEPLVEFVFEVKTDNAGVSGSTEFQLPTISGGTYNYLVKWGDGSEDNITVWNDSARTHTYASAGTYEIRISGTFSGWAFNNGGDKLKLLEIKSWGVFESGNATGAFRGCSNLILTNVTDVPDLSNTTTLARFFDNCTSLDFCNHMNDWDTSGVKNFYSMFLGCTNFNTDINDWDVSNADTYSGLNQPEGLHGMFKLCSSFNQPLNKWDLSNVKTINAMFEGANSFNQDIGMWDVGEVRDFQAVFLNNTAFNQDIGGWDVSSGLTMTQMFESSIFNQDISGWDISQVADMAYFMAGKTTADYSYLDNLYTAWGSGSTQTGVIAGFGSIEYTAAGLTGRNALLSKGWSITDGGMI